MQKLQVGQKICAGRFEIQSLLGIGGSGEVYLARDSKSESGDRLVALKVYADGSGEETPILELHARIHREAEALSKIKSDAIVKALYRDRRSNDHPRAGISGRWIVAVWRPT